MFFHLSNNPSTLVNVHKVEQVWDGQQDKSQAEHKLGDVEQGPWHGQIPENQIKLSWPHSYVKNLELFER